eukprot:2008694-Amphidinium_carterae.1
MSGAFLLYTIGIVNYHPLTIELSSALHHQGLVTRDERGPVAGKSQAQANSKLESMIRSHSKSSIRVEIPIVHCRISRAPLPLRYM